MLLISVENNRETTAIDAPVVNTMITVDATPVWISHSE